MPKVLLPKGSAYLEQISEEKLANIGSFLFRCYGNLLSKQALVLEHHKEHLEHHEARLEDGLGLS